MKSLIKSILYLFLFFIQPAVFADNQHHNIQYSFINNKLSIALDYLQEKYQINIRYKKEEIKGIIVNSTCNGCDLKGALSELLKESALSWEKINSQIMIYRKSNKKGSISGFIYDNTNKETLIGCDVYFADLNIGATSNLNGYYVIPKIPPGDYLLICNNVGYKEYKQKKN